MSVFSVNPSEGNPVTLGILDDVCDSLGVSIKSEEREDYRKLLAVFHDSAVVLMAMPETAPTEDAVRFSREDVRFPEASENQYGAWAWRCEIQGQCDSDGLLKGKSVVVKDNIAVADVPMLLGTDFIKGYVPTVDATVVTRVLEAGGKILGKAVCENLCHSGTSHSAATGPVDNPRAKGYSSGGSSSGCGVLVAVGEADLAIGADQGGSVRIPACNCGLVGLKGLYNTEIVKPTFGLVPYTGCGSNEATNDHLGPMTKTVLDNALLLQAIAGTDNIDDRGFAAPAPGKIPKYFENLVHSTNNQSLDGLKVGVIAESLTGAVMDPRVKDTFLKAADQLRKLGASVEDVSIPLHKQGPAIWTGVSKVGGYLNKTSGAGLGRRGYQMWDLNSLAHPMRQDNWDNAYVSTKNIYLNGAYALKEFPHLLAKAANLSRLLRAAYDKILNTFDVLVTPTLPYIATTHSAADAPPLEQIAKQVGLTSNTCQFNQTGHPVLTLPVGMLEIQNGPLAGSGVKLPVGMQIVGKWWHEEMVHRVAYAWEQAYDWQKL